jgi:RimJ/RimL family protein N-acetyltransferase
MISLKPITVADLPTIVQWRNDPQVNRWLSDHNKTIETARERFGFLTENPYNRYDGIYDQEKLVGYCIVKSVDMERRRCEIGLIIGEPSHWGHGVGHEVVSAMLRYCFDELRMHRVIATVVPGNERSSKLFESLGFTCEGTQREALMSHGKLVDLLVYAIDETDYRGA